jgi:hypothetical protein
MPLVERFVRRTGVHPGGPGVCRHRFGQWSALVRPGSTHSTGLRRRVHRFKWCPGASPNKDCPAGVSATQAMRPSRRSSSRIAHCTDIKVKALVSTVSGQIW